MFVWCIKNITICNHPETDCNHNLRPGEGELAEVQQSFLWIRQYMDTQFGGLAGVLVHSRTCVSLVTMGLWHVLRVLFKAMILLPCRDSCMTLQWQGHLVLSHSHLNGLPQHQSGMSATCILHTSNNTPSLTAPSSLSWLLRVDCMNFLPLPLPHPTSRGFWLSYGNQPFPGIQQLMKMLCSLVDRMRVVSIVMGESEMHKGRAHGRLRHSVPCGN